MMKKIFNTLSLFFTLTFMHSQTGQGYGIGSNGVQSDGRLIDIFENIKNRANSTTKATASIKGSPYFDEVFKTAQVEYFGTVLKDDIYLRYNAFSDEMEMSKTSSQNWAHTFQESYNHKINKGVSLFKKNLLEKK